MVDALDLLRRLSDWRTDWENARDKRVRTTLALSLDSCHALIELQDVKSDTGVLLHERVRSLYAAASSILGDRLQPEDLNTVVMALASARIYYWIRYLNGSSGDELMQLIRRRGHIYGHLPPSLSVVYVAIKAISPKADPPDEQHLSDAALELLREGCLADFAKLEVLVNRYGNG